METNPYLPPEAAVVDAPAQVAEATPAFAVSPLKLAVMSIATLGLYDLYWFYQHWAAIRRRTREPLSPFWRTFFTIFWCYSLFKAIREEAHRQGIARNVAAGMLAAGFIIANALSRLPDPFWLASFIAVFFLLPIQTLANELNAKVAPDADRNGRFTWQNIVWLVIFTPLTLLAIIVPFLPVADSGAG